VKSAWLKTRVKHRQVTRAWSQRLLCWYTEHDTQYSTYTTESSWFGWTVHTIPEFERRSWHGCPTAVQPSWFVPTCLPRAEALYSSIHIHQYSLWHNTANISCFSQSIVPQYHVQHISFRMYNQGRLSLSTVATCAIDNFLAGGIKSLILSFNTQKCEYDAQI